MLRQDKVDDQNKNAHEHEKVCIQRRAAFDIGSSTTKLQVADGDVCRQVIVKDLLSESEKVDYMEDLGQHNQLSTKIIRQGAEAV